MQIPRVLIADSGEETRQVLEQMLQGRCAMQACTDGQQAIALLESFSPDILVLDLTLPKTDGLGVLQALRSMERTVMVLVQTSLASPYVMESLRRLEADYVMQKPWQPEAMQVRLQDFLSLLSDTPPQPQNTEQLLSGVLLSLGISAKLDGYGYLLDAIPMYAEDPSQSITKELYVAVGQKRGKAGTLVERSVRSAIEKAWACRDESVWRQYFRPAPDGTVPKPSNGAFIARMAQLLAGRMNFRGVG